MLKKLLVIATIATGFISTQANAAFVPVDWKMVADNSATLDTSTGLEWLDLTQTKGKSLSEVSALLSTSYKGWRLPTLAEMLGFAQKIAPHLVIDQLNWTGYLSQSDSQTSNEIQAFLGGDGRSGQSFGFYEGTSGAHTFGVGFGLVFHDQGQLPPTFASPYYGVYLVSDGGVTLSSINNPMLNINNPNAPINVADVNAPAGFAAVGVLILMLGARRKVA